MCVFLNHSSTVCLEQRIFSLRDVAAGVMVRKFYPKQELIHPSPTQEMELKGAGYSRGRDFGRNVKRL